MGRDDFPPNREVGIRLKDAQGVEVVGEFMREEGFLQRGEILGSTVGLLIDGPEASSNAVIGVRCLECVEAGFKVADGAHSNSIENSIAHRSKGYGILLENAHDNVFSFDPERGIQLVQNEGGNILVHGGASGNRFQNLDASGSGSNAINVRVLGQGTIKNDFVECRVSGSTSRMIIGGGAGDCVLAGCRLTALSPDGTAVLIKDEGTAGIRVHSCTFASGGTGLQIGPGVKDISVGDASDASPAKLLL